MEIADNIGSLASLVGSLTVVGGALLWIYNKFIGDPREKRRAVEETIRQKRMVETITRENAPLNKSIQQLTDWLEESKKDHEVLNQLSKISSEKIKRHEKQINEHDDRLIVLETINRMSNRHKFEEMRK